MVNLSRHPRRELPGQPSHVGAGLFLNQKSEIRNQKPLAFTLLEVLTVIIIIVILIGLAALAFNTLTGRRSTSMAQNQIAAMLAQMRAMAMSDASVDPNLYGVLFFYDPNVDRTIMQPVIVGSMGDPDPNDQYKGWLQSRNNTYQVGDRVIAVVGVVMDGANPANYRPMPIRFRCKQSPVSNANANQFPPAVINFFTGALSNDFWEVDSDVNAMDVSEIPAEQLPVGVGVQLLTDPTMPATMLMPSSPRYPERYLQTGMILFDRTGKVCHDYYYPCIASPIQRRLQAASPIAYVGVYSQSGLNIYDRERFLAATQTSTGVTFTPTDQDYIFQTFLGTQPSAQDEKNEEQWLDENGKLLVLDRTSGELKEVRK